MINVWRTYGQELLVKTVDEKSVLSLIVMNLGADEVSLRVSGDLSDFSFLVIAGCCISRKRDFEIFTIKKEGSLRITHKDSQEAMKIKVAHCVKLREATFHITHSENLTAVRNELLGVEW